MSIATAFEEVARRALHMELRRRTIEKTLEYLKANPTARQFDVMVAGSLQARIPRGVVIQSLTDEKRKLERELDRLEKRFGAMLNGEPR